MNTAPSRKAGFATKCESCGCHTETMLVRFYESEDDHLLHLCLGCYESLWVSHAPNSLNFGTKETPGSIGHLIDGLSPILEKLKLGKSVNS